MQIHVQNDDQRYLYFRKLSVHKKSEKNKVVVEELCTLQCSQLSPIHALTALGGSRGSAATTRSSPRNHIGVSSQRHAQVALYP
jgi:hypothetical protein